jgi:cobalt/nickel transport system permease protein
MHISDGVLPVSVTIGSYAATMAIVAVGIRKTSTDSLPKVAVVTSAFFVASLIHVPLGPTSIHLLLPGLVGILLGPSAYISIVLGLTLQSLLFQFGGLTALGANSIMMGLPALFCGWLFRCLKGSTLTRHAIAGACIGFLGVIMAVAILAGLLYTGGEDFLGVAKLAFIAHLPVAIIEAIIAAFTVVFLFRVKPELLNTSQSLSTESRTPHDQST